MYCLNDTRNEPAVQHRPSIAHHRRSAAKSRLVNLGVACLACGEWRMVMAIAAIIRNRGWRDE